MENSDLVSPCTSPSENVQKQNARQREEEHKLLWEVVASCPPCTTRILKVLRKERTFEELKELV